MRSVLRLCVAAAVLLAVWTAAQAADEPIRMVLNKKVFIMNRPEDVMPQAQEVADMVGERIGRKIIVQSCDEEISSVLDDFKSGKVQFVFSDGLDLARLKLGKLAPGVVTTPLDVSILVGCAAPVDRGGQKPGFSRAVVLVRNDSKIMSIADLKGKRLVYGRLSEMDYSMVLLKNALHDQGVAKKEQFFGNVRRLSCEDACLISLQRDSADVTCMVEDTLLAKTAVATSLAGDFKILQASEFYPAYVCFYLKDKVPADLVEKLRAQMMELHQTVKGRMMMDVFMVRQFVALPEDSTKLMEKLLNVVEP
jgi:ABC-type phosphate/phosphonate transport system substrate-binding protein